MSSPSLRREAARAAPFLAFALVAWGAGVGAARWRGGETSAALSPWQRSFLELPDDGQRLYRAVREGIFEAENVRSETGAWPEVQRLVDDGIPPFTAAWRVERSGVYVNYLGEVDGTRWLILFIEPEPNALKTPGEAAPPVDEEHHTLPDGTALHVTVWTQPATEPLPKGVLAFPVSDGWTQLVSPRPP